MRVPSGLCLRWQDRSIFCVSQLPGQLPRREGGGRLSDDIPPPTPEERAAEEAESPEDNEMLIPGLELAPTLPPLPRPAPRPRVDPEIERLRALLADTLRELETLRALLPR